MIASKAATPSEYLAALAPERRKELAKVRALVRKNLPRGYREVIQYGMLSWVIPLSRYPVTYNGQPLAIVSLADQKRHASLYLNGVYASDAVRKRFEHGYRASGKRLDMGRSCLRFRLAEDLAFEPIAATLRAVPVEAFIELYERSRKPRRK